MKQKSVTTHLQSSYRSQKGQSLVEYLIIVAIVGIGSIGLMRALGQNLNTRFADVVYALGGKVDGNRKAADVSTHMYRKRDLKDFAQGSVTGSGPDNDSRDE
jgi:Flp pilus assembly pilin Flp